MISVCLLSDNTLPWIFRIMSGQNVACIRIWFEDRKILLFLNCCRFHTYISNLSRCAQMFSAVHRFPLTSYRIIASTLKFHKLVESRISRVKSFKRMFVVILIAIFENYSSFMRNYCQQATFRSWLILKLMMLLFYKIYRIRLTKNDPQIIFLNNFIILTHSGQSYRKSVMNIRMSSIFIRHFFFFSY